MNVYKEILFKLLENQCFHCGSDKKLEIHHKLPLRLGGSNSFGNVELVCRKCHATIHKHLREMQPPKSKASSAIDEYMKINIMQRGSL